MTLLAISAPPLVLMAREVLIGRAFAARYSVERVISPEPDMHGGALSAEIGGHRVELKDDLPFVTREPFKAGEGQRSDGFVHVLVDGRPRATPVAATIRLTHKDANRYWGFTYLMKLVDKQGPERLVVAQSLGGGTYRTISIFPDGRVVEDSFAYPDRCNPPLRAALIQYVVPHPSGFCSDVMQVWPSIFYPVLYPFVSGALGGVLVLLAAIARWRDRDTSVPSA